MTRLRVLAALVGVLFAIRPSVGTAAAFVHTGTSSYSEGEYGGDRLSWFAYEPGYYTVEFSFSEEVEQIGISPLGELIRIFYVYDTGEHAFSRQSDYHNAGAYVPGPTSFARSRIELPRPFVTTRFEDVLYRVEGAYTYWWADFSFALKPGQVVNWSVSIDHAGPIPEPSTWALDIAGFGLAGATLRRRERAAS